MKTVLFAFLFCLGLTTKGDEDRLWIEGTINGKRVRIVLDTGTEKSVLFRRTAERLQLKVTDPPADFRPSQGEVAMGFTEPCDFEFGPMKLRGEFRVFDLPSGLSMDAEGILGWSLFKDMVVSFDATTLRISIGETLPEKVAGWQKLKLVTEANTLAFKISDKGGPHSAIYVDTGDSGGVAIAPSLWEKLTASVTNQPFTLSGVYYPATGSIVRREMWANELSIGAWF